MYRSYSASTLLSLVFFLFHGTVFIENKQQVFCEMTSPLPPAAAAALSCRIRRRRRHLPTQVEGWAGVHRRAPGGFGWLSPEARHNLGRGTGSVVSGSFAPKC